eukprot:9477785-Pyramimonas_sp.AAC.1
MQGKIKGSPLYALKHAGWPAERRAGRGTGIERRMQAGKERAREREKEKERERGRDIVVYVREKGIPWTEDSESEGGNAAKALAFYVGCADLPCFRDV